MLSINTLAELDAHEDQLIGDFQQHRCFQQLPTMTLPEFHHLLLQRRFLSLAFTPVYDLAIDALSDPKARKSARRILREEYPDERGNTPSHREDLVSDLLQVGISRQTIVNSQPIALTLATLQQSFALFTGDVDDPLHQVKLLTILRFWGEVLIAAEYAALWPKLQAVGLQASGEKRSLFYYPHMVHDAKQKPLTQLSLVGSTHSDLLAISLKNQLIDTAALSYCANVATAIVQIKANFYNQFVAG